MRRIAICVNWSFWRDWIEPAVRKNECGGGGVFWEGVEEIVLFDDENITSLEITGEGEVAKIGKPCASEWLCIKTGEAMVERWKVKGKRTSLEFAHLTEAADLAGRTEKLIEAEGLLRNYFVSLHRGNVVAEETGITGTGEEEEEEVAIRVMEEEEEEAETGESSFASTTTLNEPEWSFSSTAETVAGENDARDREDGGKAVGEDTATALTVGMPEIKIMKMVLRVSTIEDRHDAGEQRANGTSPSK